ncbi:MAG: hypothetical protein P8186_02675 [Anaerolineae bacterium]|jgi:di/tricarboxylate transporter
MTFTFVVLAVTILLLVSGRLRPDLVALMSLLALFLGGIVDTQQALAGFADTAVTTTNYSGKNLSRNNSSH